MIRTFTVMIEVDTAYDDAEALLSSIKQVIDDDDEIRITVPGNHFIVVPVSIGEDTP